MPPELSLMDSRRMLGPSLLADAPGAWLEARVVGLAEDAVVAAWQAAARPMLDALAWHAEHCLSRTGPGAVTLMVTAPWDALGTAQELNEWAFARAQRSFGLGAPDGAPAGLEPDAALRSLSRARDDERRPGLAELIAAAQRHGVGVLVDGACVSLGHGQRSMSFAPESLPDPASLPWQALGNVPVTLVAGAGAGRDVLAALERMAAASGSAPSLTSQAGARIGAEPLEPGGLTGHAAAHALLRDPRTARALLEVAPADTLRLGLPVARAEVAVIAGLGSGPAADADAAFVLARAIRDGRLVLDADAAAVHERGKTLAKPLLWVSRDERHPTLRRHVDAGGDACFVAGGSVVLARRKQRLTLLPASEVRGELGAALCAAGAAFALRIAPPAIAQTLRGS